MEHARIRTARSVFLVVFCFLILPSMATAATKKRTCGSNPGQTLQHFLNELNPGDTLIVSGVCKENVVIGEGHGNLIIEGQGATIDGSGDMTRPAVRVRGRSITIKGFTIIGGRHGVQFHGGGTGIVDNNQIRLAATHGVIINNNGSAVIVNNTIEQNGSNGICICEHSVADIGFRSDFATQGSPNTVRNNGGNGILVADASYAEIESNLIYGNVSAGILVDNSASAKIGFQAGVAGTFASANTIESNGNRGVVVARSSSARIVENNIRNNTGAGVGIFRGSQADVAANIITGNTAQGVSVSQNSGVNLGNNPPGSAAQDQPNTITGNSLSLAGITCTANSYVAGLYYAATSRFIDGTCTDQLAQFP